MPECPKCNKKFQLQDALIQHLNDKKDEKHHLHDKKDESQSEIFTKNGAFILIINLTNKSNLTGNEKIKLDKAREFIKEDSKRTRIGENIGLKPSLRINKTRRRKGRRETLMEIEMDKLKLEDEEYRRERHNPVIPKGVLKWNYNPQHDGRALHHFRRPSSLIADEVKTLKKNNKVGTFEVTNKRGTRI